MPITWAHRMQTIVRIWAVFQYHIMVCRPHSTVIIRMQVKFPTNVYSPWAAVAYHQRSMDTIIIRQVQQVAMALALAPLANQEMVRYRPTRAPLQMPPTIVHSIQINRHRFFCPLNCTKVSLPMPFFTVRIKCVRIHFRAIYYFHIQTNHRIHPNSKMMKNQPFPRRLVCCVIWGAFPPFNKMMNILFIFSRKSNGTIYKQ